MVVEATKRHILCIPPPVLGGAFGELKAGLGHYHSAKKTEFDAVSFSLCGDGKDAAHHAYIFHARSVGGAP